MRTTVLLACLAIAFTAAVAAPSVSQPNPKALAVSAKLHEVKAIDEDLILDLISLILGVDVRAIIAQTEATITGLDALLGSSSAELAAILNNGGEQLVAEANAIIQNALVRAEEIVKPIVDIINAIINLIGRRDLIGDLIEALLNRIISLIEGTIQQLEDLAIETVTALQDLATNAGADIASQVSALLTRTVSEAVALVQPLLDLITPLLPGGARLDLIGLIELITGIPISDIIEQAEATAEGLAALVPATVGQIQAALDGSAAELAAQVDALLTEAIADVSTLVNRIVDLVQRLLDGGNALLLVPQLILAVNKATEEVPAIIEGTVQAIVSLTQSSGEAVSANIQQILASAVVEAQALIQPLLDLIAPLLPEGEAKLKLIA